MFYVQVVYMDSKGAGCMRGFSNEALLDKFLDRLRRDADIKNHQGESIGQVWSDSHSGGRGKWRWIYDQDKAVYGT